MTGNQIAVDLGRYKDKTIAELAGVLERCIPYIEGHFTAWPFESDRQALNRVRSELLANASAALARARLDSSWQQYSRDNEEPLDLAE